MFKISYPECAAKEALYVIEIIFDEWLGLPFSAIAVNRNDIIIEAEERLLTVPSVFFPAFSKGQDEQLLLTPLKQMNFPNASSTDVAINKTMPVLFGDNRLEISETQALLGNDIFGAAFFMLSRLEETRETKRDIYNRFPITASIAYKNGFIDRPIIDDYVELLWQILKRLWPGLERRTPEFEIVPTHDVDTPSFGASTNCVSQLMWRCAGDVLKTRDMNLAFRRASSYARVLYQAQPMPKEDPYNSFNWLMSKSEEAGIQSRFYFTPIYEPKHQFGGQYSLKDAHIERLIEEISNRGHEVGIHPTGESYENPRIFKAQASEFFKTMKRVKVPQTQFGGRQHVLLWDQAQTPKHWGNAGLVYDSSLGHAECAGFRCGTSHPYSLWDFEKRQKLTVKEMPLILMEISLLSKSYMGCSDEEAYEVIEELKAKVKVRKGKFVFLWHNSSLIRNEDMELYEACLA